MAIMRTLPNAVKELKEKDPGCAITCDTLRRWVKQGSVISVRTGKNFLINMESLEKFLAGGRQ